LTKRRVLLSLKASKSAHHHFQTKKWSNAISDSQGFMAAEAQVDVMVVDIAAILAWASQELGLWT
jgi:hypothetical protein